MGAHAGARRRVPPVLHVALGELARRGAAAICARSMLGRGPGQRHRVLQLVAKAVGAAGLVEAGLRPQPAGHRLVQQPAVDQRVEQRVGRAAPWSAPSSSSQVAARALAALRRRTWPRRWRPAPGARPARRHSRAGTPAPPMSPARSAMRVGERGAGVEPAAAAPGRSGRAARRPPRASKHSRRSQVQSSASRQRPRRPRKAVPPPKPAERSRCVHSRAVMLALVARRRARRRLRRAGAGGASVYVVPRSARLAPIIHSAMPIARRCSVRWPRLTSRSRTCLTALGDPRTRSPLTSRSPRRWLMPL